MKIIKTHSPAGDWWEFEDFVERDLKVDIDPVTVRPSRRPYYSTAVKITFRQDAVDQILVAVTDGNQLHELLCHTQFGSDVYRSSRDRLSLADLIGQYHTSRGIGVEVRLRNVRKKETRTQRHLEAEQEALALSRPDGDVVRKIIEEAIDSLNAGVRRFVAEENANTLKKLENSLRGYEPWIRVADEYARKQDPSTVDRLTSAIDKVEKKIKVLQSELDEHFDALRTIRSDAWIAMFEKDNWVWDDADSDASHRWPEPLIEATKNLVAEGKTFKVIPKHHRSFIVD